MVTVKASSRPTTSSPADHHHVSRWAKSEAFFFNQGANLAFLGLMLALNILMLVWGTYEFTGTRFVTDSDILRVTLPIARAGGRVVTWNAALIFLSGSKYLWTWLRQSPLHLGFPIDNVMPYYHKMIAWTIIFMGCVVHTIPQVINYATKELRIEGGPIWLWGDGLATKQLLVTGIFLFWIFAGFFMTTLERVRRTTWGFRLFWVAHMISITCVLPLLIIHGTIRGKPILMYTASLPIAIYIVDSFMRRMMYKTVQAGVVRFRAFGGEGRGGGEKVVELILRSSAYKYRPGQYAEIQIPELSRYEWHPFTIASAPNSDNTVSFCIKALGRWTNGLFDLADTFQGGDVEEPKAPLSMTVNLRGPFGAPAQNYLNYRHLVVIGSGIGVTPLLSVWAYLVRATKGLVKKVPPPSTSEFTAPSSSFISEDMDLPFDEVAEDRLLACVDVNAVDVVEMDRPFKTLRGKLAYYASTLETMTVNICLFLFSLFVEVTVFSVWLFGFGKEAALIQIIASTIALIIFGSKVALSLVVYGGRYVRSLVFALEMGIVLLDGAALATAVSTRHSPSKPEAISYFVFYGAFIALHSVRIFHIFYATARPPHTEEPTRGVDAIHSVTGIWVAKKYEDMSFAAPSLVRTLPGLSKVFSLRLFATRDKEEDLVHRNPLADHGPDHILTAGRPDWDALLAEALEKAHTSHPEGDAVGVFFCGAPAIARTLQRTAHKVTAQHHYRVRRATGTACRCRVLVHKENF
jgi:respiratory burst oxidase